MFTKTDEDLFAQGLADHFHGEATQNSLNDREGKRGPNEEEADPEYTINDNDEPDYNEPAFENERLPPYSELPRDSIYHQKGAPAGITVLAVNSRLSTKLGISTF